MIIKNKKALSEMVGYVILIVIAISLSILVFAFIKGSLWKPQEKCNDGVNLNLENYLCNSTAREITLILKNRGTFSADGFVVKASLKDGGMHPLTASGQTSLAEISSGKIVFNDSMAPGSSKEFTFLYPETGEIKSIEIEPIEIKDSGAVLCEELITTQEISCPA